MTCKRCGFRLFAAGDLELHQQVGRASLVVSAETPSCPVMRRALICELILSRSLQSNGDKFSYRKQVKMHRQGSSQQP
jgi:hypothetical protein